jgi:hypothetical protein
MQLSGINKTVADRHATTDVDALDSTGIPMATVSMKQEALTKLILQSNCYNALHNCCQFRESVTGGAICSKQYGFI